MDIYRKYLAPEDSESKYRLGGGTYTRTESGKMIGEAIGQRLDPERLLIGGRKQRFKHVKKVGPGGVTTESLEPMKVHLRGKPAFTEHYVHAGTQIRVKYPRPEDVGKPPTEYTGPVVPADRIENVKKMMGSKLKTQAIKYPLYTGHGSLGKGARYARYDKEAYLRAKYQLTPSEPIHTATGQIIPKLPALHKQKIEDLRADLAEKHLPEKEINVRARQLADKLYKGYTSDVQEAYRETGGLQSYTKPGGKPGKRFVERMHPKEAEQFHRQVLSKEIERHRQHAAQELRGVREIVQSRRKYLGHFVQAPNASVIDYYRTVLEGDPSKNVKGLIQRHQERYDDLLSQHEARIHETLTKGIKVDDPSLHHNEAARQAEELQTLISHRNFSPPARPLNAEEYGKLGKYLSLGSGGKEVTAKHIDAMKQGADKLRHLATDSGRDDIRKRILSGGELWKGDPYQPIKKAFPWGKVAVGAGIGAAAIGAGLYVRHRINEARRKQEQAVALRSRMREIRFSFPGIPFSRGKDIVERVRQRYLLKLARQGRIKNVATIGDQGKEIERRLKLLEDTEKSVDARSAQQGIMQRALEDYHERLKKVPSRRAKRIKEQGRAEGAAEERSYFAGVMRKKSEEHGAAMASEQQRHRRSMGLAIGGTAVVAGGAGYALGRRKSQERQFSVIRFEEDDPEEQYRKWTASVLHKKQSESLKVPGFGRPRAVGPVVEKVQKWGGRLGRLHRDIAEGRKGPLVDARGRKRTPEWEKPWVKVAATGALIGGGYLAWRGFPKHGIPGIRNWALNTPLAQHVAGIKMEAAEALAKPKAENPLQTLVEKSKEFPGQEILDIRKSGAVSIKNQEKLAKERKELGAQKVLEKIAQPPEKKAKVIKFPTGKRSPNPPKNLSSRLREIRFQAPDWGVAGRSSKTAVVYAPGSGGARERREKKWYEKKYNQTKLWQAGLIGTTVVGAGAASLAYRKELLEAARKLGRKFRPKLEVVEKAGDIGARPPHAGFRSKLPVIRFGVMPYLRNGNEDQKEPGGVGHDIATGAIEGGLAYPASEWAYRKLIGSGAPSTLKKIAVGGAVGGLATGAVGFLVARAGARARALAAKRRQMGQQEMRSKLRLIQFRQDDQPPRPPLVTKSRYATQVTQQDYDRANRHYIQTALLGGALGAAFRGKVRPSKAILAGAGIGVGAQAGIRAYGYQHRGPYGERTWQQKRAEKTLPVVGASVLAGKLIGKERLKRIFLASRNRPIYFDSNDKSKPIAAGAGAAGFVGGSLYRGRKALPGEDLTGRRVIRSHSMFPFMQHEGVGTGPDSITHVVHVPSMGARGIVQRVSRESFSKGKPIYVMGRAKPEAAAASISRVGQQLPYTLLRRNCQLFGDECRGAARLTRSFVPRQLRTAITAGGIAAGGAYGVSKLAGRKKHEFAAQDDSIDWDKWKGHAQVAGQHGIKWGGAAAAVGGIGAAALGAPFLPGAAAFLKIPGREIIRKTQTRLARTPLIRSVIKAPKRDPQVFGKGVHDYIEGSQRVLNTGLHGRLIGKGLQTAIAKPGSFVGRQLRGRLGMDDWSLKHWSKFRSGHLQALSHWGDEWHDLFVRQGMMPYREGAGWGQWRKPKGPGVFKGQWERYHKGRAATEGEMKDLIENKGFSHIEAFRHVTQKSTNPHVQAYMRDLATSKKDPFSHYPKLAAISPALVVGGGATTVGGITAYKHDNQR